MPSASHLPSPKPDASVNFSAALGAGILATVITHPPDMIKTRMQLDPQRYRSTWVTARLLRQEQGLLGFFRGVGPRAVRKACSAAITWTLYEECVRIAQRIYRRL